MKNKIKGVIFGLICLCVGVGGTYLVTTKLLVNNESERKEIVENKKYELKYHTEEIVTEYKLEKSFEQLVNEDESLTHDKNKLIDRLKEDFKTNKDNYFIIDKIVFENDNSIDNLLNVISNNIFNINKKEYFISNLVRENELYGVPYLTYMTIIESKNYISILIEKNTGDYFYESGTTTENVIVIDKENNKVISESNLLNNYNVDKKEIIEKVQKENETVYYIETDLIYVNEEGNLVICGQGPLAGIDKTEYIK